MGKKLKNKIAKFDFKDMSSKQKKVIHWWHHPATKDKDIIIMDGAIRSGKTISGICSFFDWSIKSFKNQNFIISGKSIGSLKRNVIEPSRQILAAWNLSSNYNRSSNFIEAGKGNTYYLFGANNESSQDTLQGLTAAGAFADEVALFPRSFVEQMIGRCSVEGSKVFCNCNPNSPHHYFKTEYIDLSFDKQIYYLHFDMDDNLTLSEKVKEKYKRMFQGVFYKRYILGLWVVAEGIIYDMFDEKIHVIDTANLKDIEQYYISCDYGVHNAFSMGLWGKLNGIWYRMKEYYYSGKDSNKQKDNELYYNDLVDFAGNRKIRSIIIDPSASSFIQTIKKHNKFNVRYAKNDVSQGIENTGTAFNLNQFKIDKQCKNIIKELYSYSWDEKAAEKGIEKPIKVLDHACDDMRYFINTIIYNNESAIQFI